MKKFKPQRVLIEKQALDYPLAKKLETQFLKEDTPVDYIESHNRVSPAKEMEPIELFNWTKETLVIGTKKTLRFKSCQPSADYRLVTSTSCPAKCEYCYLAKNLGSASYVRIYVNLEEILKAVKKHIRKGHGEIITFEASSSSDPVAVEHLTGSLAKTIEYFGKQDKGRLRVVTKFAGVDSLLNLEHQRHTRFRFSLNTKYVIDTFEHLTSSLKERINAASKIQAANYPLGFILAPLMIYDGWQEGYTNLLNQLKESLSQPTDENLTFELIMHRFSTRSKNLIEARFPNTKLKLNKKDYQHKGFGKYVYPEHEADKLKKFLSKQINDLFPKAKIEYFT
ncbi:spore photoproduct lyase [Halobacteroides halobius DSM 5150]|uniref:Spore photoproduct lyase n=1 Tax=Halobacteroides halobius (strain ATCC 35273 / DSM 5150 / MD-1) TaxID=748449 RepID=L0K9X3_HALHC|nr:spore photoproduct lyase [Halobacteroides halobius]AGB41315.1 spore photoproduct lyase [Halobacteroides halobius DSM 5150]